MTVDEERELDATSGGEDEKRGGGGRGFVVDGV